MLEAALGPLSAPQPTDGERDLRPSDQRRGEALVALVKRAVASAETTPKSTKSQLFVTVDLETLRNGLRGAGETLAGSDPGMLLAPETVRRLACDATIIPTVLGVAGAVVDLGMDERLFTAAQAKRLWLRDGHCTYPGCDMPASVVRRASPGSLGRRRPHRPRQRCPSLRTAPHDRAHPAVRGAPGGGPGRNPRRVVTCGPAPTTSCSPGSPCRNPRDPAPHPASPGGVAPVSATRGKGEWRAARVRRGGWQCCRVHWATGSGAAVHQAERGGRHGSSIRPAVGRLFVERPARGADPT